MGVPPFPRRVTTRWASFSVVAVHNAREVTGLTLKELLAVPGVEQMTRIKGRSHEQAVRVPTELLEAAAQDREAVAAAIADYTSGGSDAALRARIREIIAAREPSA